MTDLFAPEEIVVKHNHSNLMPRIQPDVGAVAGYHSLLVY